MLPQMLAIGAQHTLAMFGGTALVPILTGFPVSTTVLFSGIGTLVFLVVTAGRVPSYTGSSFAFIAPVLAAKVNGGVSGALGGIVCTGILLAVIGGVVHYVGPGPVARLLPPTVTGAVVVIVGLNLAPVAKDQFSAQPGIAVVTLLAILLAGVLLRGLWARLSILLGICAGYALAAVLGEVDWSPVERAPWVGIPELTAPTFEPRAIVLIVPAVLLVLLAENAGHVKAVSAVTGDNLDGMLGRSYIGDGLATCIAGSFGGSGTTTYAENIGVMGLTRVYSTLAYLIAGCFAILLGLLPKFGAAVSAMPVGVVGGAATALFGLIAVLGARIWIDGPVDFRDYVNLSTVAVALIVGVGDFTLQVGDYRFAGIACGSVTAIVVYHVLRTLQRRA
ncbi:uracil-xanthine permease family protein [Kribbella sp. NPDC049227]|uniref:uracil-xanthine permease family protein n=1 Tax=Kribbella sp. NPDC049227 TaxID=3364113 RepID=UPI0037245290